jgi:tetratricopeptide (TPR) repeat protein
VALLAYALLHLNQPADALRMAERAAALAPEHEWPHRLRSLILLRLGRRRDALAAAEAAVACAPGAPQPLRRLVYCQLACWRLGDARRTAERLVELAPEWAEAHLARAAIALRQFRYRDAEVDARRALALEPENWDALNSLGVALQGQLRRREALAAFHAAARTAPGVEPLRRNLDRAIEEYATAPPPQVGFAFVLLIAFLHVLADRLDDAAKHVVIVINAILVLGYTGYLFILRRQRLASLHPELGAFRQHQRSRQDRVRERRTKRLTALAGVVVSVIGAVRLLQGQLRPGERAMYFVLVLTLVALARAALDQWGSASRSR